MSDGEIKDTYVPPNYALLLQEALRDDCFSFQEFLDGQQINMATILNNMTTDLARMLMQNIRIDVLANSVVPMPGTGRALKMLTNEYCIALLDGLIPQTYDKYHLSKLMTEKWWPYITRENQTAIVCKFVQYCKELREHMDHKLFNEFYWLICDSLSEEQHMTVYVYINHFDVNPESLLNYCIRYNKKLLRVVIKLLTKNKRRYDTFHTIRKMHVDEFRPSYEVYILFYNQISYDSGIDLNFKLYREESITDWNIKSSNYNL